MKKKFDGIVYELEDLEGMKKKDLKKRVVYLQAKIALLEALNWSYEQEIKELRREKDECSN